MHAPVRNAISAPSVAGLGTLDGKFATGDIAHVPGVGPYTFSEAVPSTIPVDSALAPGGGIWLPSAADAGVAYVETTREIDLVTAAGQNAYRLPLGCYVAADARDARVFLDGAEIFYSAVPAANTWKFYYSGMNNPQIHGGPPDGWGGPPWPPFWPPPPGQRPSVQDVASGIMATGAPFAPGLNLKIRWIERTSAFRPKTVSPVFLSRPDAISLFSPNYTTPWTPSNASFAPNAITIPQGPPGFVPELWRMTKHIGGESRYSNPMFFGNGKRFVPYFRGPQPELADPNSLLLVEFANHQIAPVPRPQPIPFPTAYPLATPSARKLRYRVCYYHPTLRIRSDFAAEYITVFNSWQSFAPPNGPGYAGDNHNKPNVSAIRAVGIVSVSPS
jgi:hypothetical protein